MNILVTGKNGFIAKNVIEYFGDNHKILAVSHEEDLLLKEYCKQCDLVFHLAAVQRSQFEEDFWTGNVEYTKKLLRYLCQTDKKVPIIFSTSVGIDHKSAFADTKLEAERLIREYGVEKDVPVYVFKLNHIFGKYGKPNFNNVIATFCYNIVHGIPLIVNNPAVMLNFTYIDDLMKDFSMCVDGTLQVKKNEYFYTTLQFKRSIGEVVMVLGNIVNDKEIQDDFDKKLFWTYLSYKRELE